MRLLQEHLDDIKADHATGKVRVVILTHSGPAFSAGHDLKELTGMSGSSSSSTDCFQADYGPVFDQCSHLMQSIVRLPQPVIAKVNGIATAAGCQVCTAHYLNLTHLTLTLIDTYRLAPPAGGVVRPGIRVLRHRFLRHPRGKHRAVLQVRV
jgi:hypothetical protein